MGRLTDMLPEIESAMRTRDILEFLGCARLGCEVVGQDDPVRFGRWIRHNDETQFFDDIVEAQAQPVFRSGSIVEGPVAYIPRHITAWITQQHAALEERREQERRAAIDADPWRRHAAMVSLSDA